MKKRYFAIVAFAGISFVYILCLYLWYATIHGRSLLISSGPYIVQALTIGLTINIFRPRFVPLELIFVVIIFATATAFAHLVAHYFGVTVDWPGISNFHLVFFIQLVISAIIALCVWMLFSAAVYFFEKKHGD